MKKITILIMLLISFWSWAQTDVIYTGMGSITCPAIPVATISTPPTGLLFSQITRGGGVTCGTSSTGISGSAFNGVLASNISANSWYTFTITSNAATAFTLNSLSIVSRVSAITGSPNVSVQYAIGAGVMTVLGSYTPTTSAVTYSITPSSSITVPASTVLTIYIIPNNLTALGTTCRVENNTSVNVSTGITSVQSGDWNTASTWDCNCIPTSSSNVTIANSHIVSTSNSISRTGNTTVNGAFQINQGGFASGGTWAYGSSGSLIFNHTSGTYGTIDSSHSYWPSANSPFNVTINNSSSGGINLGVSRTVGGTFATAAGVSLSSATLTLNGNCQINAGGFFNNTPTYGSASTLIYNTASNSNYNVGNEWTGNSTTAGLGIPQNVTIQYNATVTMPSGDRGFAGNMTVISGGITLNATSGDIYVGGNWTIGAAASQINNGRAVYFNGTANQTMTKTGGGTLYFDYLVVNKSAGTLYLDFASPTDITINTATGDVLQLLNSGLFDLNGREIKLQNAGGNIFTNDSRSLTSSVSGAKLSVNGTKYVTGSGTLSMAQNIDIYLAAAMDFGSNKTTINGLLQLNYGGSVINNAPIYSNTSTLKYFTSGTFGRTLEWNANAATATFPSEGYPNHVQISNNTTLDLGANSGSLTEKAITGNLTIDNGSKLDMAGSSAMTKPLTVFGDVNVGTAGGTANLTLSVNSGADLKVGGNLTFNGAYNFYPNARAVFFIKNGTQTISATSTLTIPYVVLAPISGSNTVQLLGTDLNITAPNDGNAIDLGSQSGNNFDINGQTLTIGTSNVGNLIVGSGKFKGSATSNLTLLGTGSIDKLNFTTDFRNLGSLTINRQALTTAATLGTDVTINNALVLTNGNLVLNASDLILTSNATSTNNGSSSFIIAQGNGQFKKYIDSNGSFTFPIGETTSGLDYSPATLTYTAASYTNAFIAVKVNDGKHPNNTATINYITRYWSVTSSGITSPNYSFSGTYTTADIIGTESSSKPGRYNGTNWTDISPTSISSNTLTLTGLTVFSATNDFSAGGPLSFQEINVQQAATDYLTSSTYAFGNKEVGSSTDVVFTIQNLGAADLTITSTTVSGTGFSLITSPNSPVTGSTTFTIRFLPNAIGPFSGSVTIINNDADEGTYVINFTGTGIASSSSDIIANSSFSYNSNINYLLFQAATITNTGMSGATGGSVDLFKFDIRDGGASANDLDTLPTILSAISFNVTNTSMIRSAALFDGNTMVANTPVINTGAGTIAFTGLSGGNVTANDNTTKSLTLRVTFLTSVTDNTQFQVTIANTNVTPASGNTSSLFSAFTSVVSSTTTDRNRLEVTADRLAFVQQPSNTTVNVSMTPSVTVRAIDVNSNIDLDYTGTIGITSTGTLSGTPVNATASSGVATYSSLTHTATGTGLTLTATTTGLASSNTVGSSTFNITAILFSNGDYKTTSSGNWHSTTGSGTATWQQYNSALNTWSSATEPSASTTKTVYIYHSIMLVGNNTATNIVIENGGVLSTFTVAPTWTNVLVKTGGTLNKESNGFKMNSSGILEVEDGATFTYKHTNTTARSTNLWFGTEKFHPNSNFKIITSDATVQNIFENIDDISEYIDTNNNNYAACFGNIIIDCSVGSFQLAPSGFVKNLTHGDLILRSNSDTKALFSGSFTTTIGGSLIVESTYNNNANLVSTASTGNLTIKGDIIHSAGKPLTLINNASGNITVTVKGNITVNPSSTGTLNLLGTSGGTSTVNLEGDLSVGTSGLLNTAYTSGNATFNFTGIGNGLSAATTQTIDIASSGSTENQYINFNVNSGAYVQLANNDFQLGKNSVLNVNSGGVFDFGFSGTTPLIVGISGAATGTTFASNSGSTLKITSPDGINKLGSLSSLGNVQVTPSKRTFDQTATFHYIGKTNQVTGDAITSGSTSKNIICEMNTDLLQLSFTNSTGIITPGLLDIRKGQVIESLTAYITGSTGGLSMSANTLYQIPTLSLSGTDYIPRLTNNSGDYTLTGGTIELNGAGTQVLRGNYSYKNLTYSTSGTKTISSGTPSITGTATISGTTILDIDNKSFGGSNTNITMTGTSQFKLGGSGLKPDATGTYSLASGTTIEFYGTSATNIRAGISSPVISYSNVIVNGTNVATNYLTSGVQFQSGGNFTVKNGATFKCSNTAGFNSTTVTAISSTNNPTITLETGSTVEYAGTNQTLTPISSPNPYYNMVISGSGTKSISSASEILVGNNLNVTGGILQVDSDKLLTVTNMLTNSSGNYVLIKNRGSLVQINDGIADSGTIKMTRTSRSMIQNDYIYWGSPVIGDVSAQISATNFDASYMWDLYGTVDGTWNNITTTTPGRGFITRVSASGVGAKDFDFTGTPNNGVINVPPALSYTHQSLGDTFDTVATGNTILLANPYPSAIDANLFVAANKNSPGNMEGTLYFWTSISQPNANGFYTANDYASWNTTGSTGIKASTDTSGTNILKPTGKIAAGQGFFAQIHDDANIIFNNSMRVRTSTDNGQFFRNGATNEKNRIWLNLTNSANAFRQMLVGYVTGASNDRDILYDGDAFTDNEINLYSILNTKPMVIQGRALPFENTDTVPLGYKVTTAGDYTISIDEVDGLFADGQPIYIEDLLLNITHEVSQSAYDFSSLSGTFDNRFVLRYTDTSLGIHTVDISNAVHVYTKNHQIFVQSELSQLMEVSVYDVLGRLLFDNNNIKSRECVSTTLTEQQTLIVKIKLDNEQVLIKKILLTYN